MKIVEKVSNQTGRSVEDLMANACVQDFGYEWHNACDGDHCRECWEGPDYKVKSMGEMLSPSCAYCACISCATFPCTKEDEDETAEDGSCQFCSSVTESPNKQYLKILRFVSKSLAGNLICYTPKEDEKPCM